MPITNKKEFGLYIHIPLCRKKCAYCDFYSLPCGAKTLADREIALASTIAFEMWQRRSYLPPDAEIDTIYIGGGTPSLLMPFSIWYMVECAQRFFPHPPMEEMEITMEATPDDLTDKYLEELASKGVNRLSIGVQSMDDGELKMMNRRHTAKEAEEAVRRARKYFDNISLDLIYGLPGQTEESWRQTLEKTLDLCPDHLSAYCLEIHERTAMQKLIEKGKLTLPSEEEAIAMYKTLVSEAKARGMEHYEISNFAMPNKRSRHNSKYWSDTPYIGVGPAAHSYNLMERQWNEADYDKYIRETNQSNIPCEVEYLSERDGINDYVTTSVRTAEGIDTEYMKGKFGADAVERLMRDAEPLIKEGLLVSEEGHLHLTEESVFLSDKVMLDLFLGE